MNRDSTIIYRSFYEAIKELPKENQAEVWNAIFEYALNFNEVELTGLSKTIFILIKPKLDANNKRFMNGKKEKKKPEKSKTESKPEQKVIEYKANVKQSISKTEANNNNNYNLNLNNNYNVNKIQTYFNDLENSQEFEAICRLYKFSKEYLSAFVDEFKVKTKLDYPNFSEFVSHFKNFVFKKIKDEQSNSKTNKPGAYDPEALSNFNNALKELPEG